MMCNEVIHMMWCVEYDINSLYKYDDQFTIIEKLIHIISAEWSLKALNF